MILRQTPELKLKETLEAYSEQNARDAQCKEIKRICLKADKVKLARRRHLEAEGEIMYNNLQRAKEAQDRQNAELKEVQKLAQVMAELKHQELVNIKTKQLFQNNSYEYRRLKKQSQNARVQDEILSQIKEKEIMQKEEKARKYYDDKKILDLLQNNYNELQCTEKQTRIARMKEELLSQIKEKETIQKEKKVGEYYNDIKMIEAKNNDNMDRKETGNNCKPQENAKMKSIKEEMEMSLKIKNELKEKERKKIKDEENQQLQNFQKLNETEKKKICEKRQKMIEYRNELETMIDQKLDIKNKQRIQMLNFEEYIIEMNASTNICM